MKTIKEMLKSERGSVMLEFCLVLPIWLVIFGGTFLLFDASMGRLHLLESNRNLAWIQNDRFDRNNRIDKELYRRATLYYDIRNVLEHGISGEQMWGFGKNRDSDSRNWGMTGGDFKENEIELDSGSGGGLLGNNWSMLCSGNMELKMEKISALYLGATSVVSVMYPVHDENGEEIAPLYRSAFTFTRSVDDEGNPKLHNGEMMVLRKKALDTRGNIVDMNDLLSDRTVYRTWPSNGTMGTASIYLGFGGGAL